MTAAVEPSLTFLNPSISVRLSSTGDFDRCCLMRPPSSPVRSSLPYFSFARASYHPSAQYPDEMAALTEGATPETGDSKWGDVSRRLSEIVLKGLRMGGRRQGWPSSNSACCLGLSS